LAKFKKKKSKPTLEADAAKKESVKEESVDIPEIEKIGASSRDSFSRSTNK